MSKAVIAAAAKKIAAFNPARCNALVGLDGFVDSIIDVVDKRTDAAHYSRIETIGQLAERLARAAGLSSNLELVIRQMKLGGNGPIMANALLQSGCKTTYIGSVGREVIHPVFAEMAERCAACYGLCEPALTDALEFRDGKVMLGKNHALKEVTYERLLEVVGLEKLRSAWRGAHLVALTNWTMLPLQTDIWKRLLVDMVETPPPTPSPPVGRGQGERSLLFIDLADPEKRPAQEIAEALHLLKGFRATHRVFLGVNQKESLEVGAALGFQFKAEQIEQNATRLRDALELDGVVVHPTRSAACATEKGTACLDGPYCADPKLTTGAGDNFNAGFCIGLLAKLEPAELLAVGTACSGYYVRHGRSATNAELGEFLGQWAARHGDQSF